MPHDNEKETAQEPIPMPIINFYLSQPTICGIPAEGIEAVYWGNELIWEKTKEDKPSLS